MTQSTDQIFDELREHLRDGTVYIKEASEAGRKVVGYYCAFSPKELIYAGKAIPVGLCGTGEKSIAPAEQHLPRNLCPLVKSSYGYALTDTCPYLHFCDFVVGETTCDGKKKMYELLNKIKPTHVMQLPQTNSRPEDFEYWRKEMYLLKRKIEETFHVAITDEDLEREIYLLNRERKALIEFYRLAALTPPAITGREIRVMTEYADKTFDKEQLIKKIEKITHLVKEAWDKGERRISPSKPRILITGCPIGGNVEKVIEIIEDNGGAVVGFETCGGLKSVSRFVDENKHPMDALTERYLQISCSCLTPNRGRLDLLSDIIDEYHVDGIVEVVLQACHTYNIETYTIREFAREQKNIPYLSLETDYSRSDTGQLSTRISAFIEMF